MLVSSRLLLRSGLEALLRGQPQIDITGAATDPPPGKEDFDLILWDVEDLSPRSVPFRFLALLLDSRKAPAWLDAGAAGVVLETCSLEELLDAIRQVSRGDAYLPRVLAKEVLASPRSHSSSKDRLVEPLTDREQEVLRLLAQGLSNKDIAQKLYLSVRTVEGHLGNSYGKLQVKSRTEAALWASHHLS